MYVFREKCPYLRPFMNSVPIHNMYYDFGPLHTFIAGDVGEFGEEIGEDSARVTNNISVYRGNTSIPVIPVYR